MSTHSFVRVDCKAFAKCGVKSLSHCRRYRGEDNYCKVLLFVVNLEIESLMQVVER